MDWWRRPFLTSPWISRGVLPAELREHLDDELVAEYDLGYLFAGEVNGLLRWIVIRSSDVYWGPVIGPLFSDSVLTGWQRYDPTQYVPPIA